MEYKTRDRINSAVESWRRELAGQAGLTAEIRRELETHLADCISAFRQLGLSDEECFRLACQRIGRPQKLDAEFEKVMNPATFWKRPMLIAAWAVFVVSFFLPSYTVMRGWQCALLQHTFWPQVLQGDLMAIHYELLTFANLLIQHRKAGSMAAAYHAGGDDLGLVVRAATGNPSRCGRVENRVPCLVAVLYAALCGRGGTG